MFYETKNCLRCGNPFVANKIIKGDDCCESCNRLNDITYWYPVLFRNKIPTPKTIILYTNIELSKIVDNVKIEGFDNFINSMKVAIKSLGLPVFLRTGYTSNKHDWENSCFIKNENNLASHIFNLVEFSHIMTIDRFSPCDFWAIREFIETESYFTYFENMPITKERRYFVRNGKIECEHSYWDVDIFKEIDKKIIKKLNIISKKDKEILDSMAVYISNKFSGYWSIDFLKGKNGQWYCTDMAIGERSFHVKHSSKKKKQ